MQQDTSKSTAVAKVGDKPRRTRRVFTAEQQSEMLAYADLHGLVKCCEHFSVVPSVIYRLNKLRKQGGTEIVKVQPTKRPKANMMMYHTAKHVKGLLKNRRKATDEPDDLELYCWLLVKEILG